MGLIAVPNISEGRNGSFLSDLERSIETGGGRVLDVHVDEIHNRTVFTTSGSDTELLDGMVALAAGCQRIDVSQHEGVHPRLGGLDVCPFVPIDSGMERAVEVVQRAGRAIADETGLPVYLYEAAATREETRSLPQIRRGGLEALARRAAGGFTPDFGPREIDLHRGVVCVGARGALIAFNVWLESDGEAAQRIANRVRTGGGGPPGIRALAWQLSEAQSQVSMNLIAPDETGIDRAFAEVERLAQNEEARITGTEIVGLPLQRHMPDPQKEAARLLIAPGRSLETELRN